MKKYRSKTGRFQFWVVGDEYEDTAMLLLPAHPKKTTPGISVRQTKVTETIDLGGDIEIYIDFDKDGQAISLEILTYDESGAAG